MKELNIRAKEYFSVSQYSCIDLAMANALTVFNEKFYEIYCTYLGIEMNWACGLSSKNILDIFGVVSRQFICKNAGEFEKAICNSIDDNSPLVLIPISNTIFYSYFYKDMNYKGRHALIIYGYDINKRIFLVKENIHVTEYNNVKIKGTPFYTFAITYNQLYEIYEESIKQCEKNEAILISLKEVQEKELNPIETLAYFSQIDLFENNCLVQKINEIECAWVQNMLQNETLPIYVRRNYINSLEGIIKIYNHYVESLPICQMKKTDLLLKCKSFSEQRTVKVNLLMKLLIGKRKNMNSILEEIKEGIIKNDKEFQENVRKVLDITYVKEEKIDYARNCIVTADSYRKFPAEYPPENAVSGKWATGNDFECWFSTAYAQEHWLLFDLGDVRNIEEFVLRHYEGKNGDGYLVDYEILVSVDGVNYNTVVNQHNNKETVNHCKVETTQCRWIKLLMTKTMNKDGLYAVLEFEAWGY